MIQYLLFCFDVQLAAGGQKDAGLSSHSGAVHTVKVRYRNRGRIQAACRAVPSDGEEMVFIRKSNCAASSRSKGRSPHNEALNLGQIRGSPFRGLLPHDESIVKSVKKLEVRESKSQGGQPESSTNFLNACNNSSRFVALTSVVYPSSATLNTLITDKNIVQQFACPHRSCLAAKLGLTSNQHPEQSEKIHEYVHSSPTSRQDHNQHRSRERT